MRRIFRIILFFLIPVFLCSKTAPAQNPQLNEVVLQLKWYHQFQFAGYYAADINGFYEDEGLNIVFKEGGPNLDFAEIVTSGEADLGISDTGLLVNFANGQPVVALDATFQTSPSVIAAKRTSGINNLADLADATIMSGTGFAKTELFAVLEQEGIPKNELSLYTDQYSLEEFINNPEIDAIHTYYTISVPEIESQGVPLITFFPSTYGVDFYGDVLFTSQQFLDQSSSVVERFRRASKKGWEYARENQQEIVDYIIELPGVKERGQTELLLNIEADRMWDISIPEVVPYGYMNEQRWNQIARYYAESDLIPLNIDLEDFLITPEESLIDQIIPILKYVVLGILLLIAGVSLWLYMLRSEVKKRTDLWVKEFKERQKATKQLEAKERDFKMLVENIHDCVFSMNDEAVFTYVSPNVEQITGYTVEEVEKVRYAPFFPEKNLKELFSRFNARIDTGIDDNATIQILHKNGTKRWISATTKVFEHPLNGTLVQGTFRDVTDNVRTQQALNHSEERFRKLTEQSPVGIYILSGDEYIYVNSKYASIFGAKQSDFIGEKINPDYIASEDVPLLFENIKKLFSGEINQTDNLYRAFNVSGDEIYIHFYSSVIFVNDERLLFGTALDVTNQVNTQKELQEQEERFRTLTEKSFTGLVLVQGGEIQYINPRYLEIIGYEREEIRTSEDLFKLTHPEDVESVRKSVEDRKNGNIDHVHYQCRMFHKKGHIVYLDIYGSVVTDNGKDAIMASVMDISDIVNVQNKLEDSVHEKNVLLAEIHHRVKNNMAVVSGLMELQKFKTKDKIAQGLLKESQLRIKTIAMIHEKLYQSDSFAEIPFGDYISDLVENITQSLYQESTKIKIIEEYDTVSLNINQAIPAALFTNEVITNCFKHAFPGDRKGEVRISLKNVNDDHVCIKISDNGVGLPENNKEVEKSLGMTLIKNLSNQVHAELTITNENGTGFEICFKKEAISGSASNRTIK